MKRAKHYWQRWNKTPLGLAGIFVFALVLGGLIWYLSHKPHGDVARTPTSSGASCVGVVTEQESQEMLMQLSLMNASYFKGSVTQDQLHATLEALLEKLNAEGDSRKAGILKATTALENDKEISAHVAKLTVRAIQGQPISESDRRVLQELEVEDPDGYIQDNVARTHPYIQTLLGHGATLDDDGLNISGLELNALALKDQPDVYTALAALFSPEIASGLMDTHRREALVHNSWVFYPPIRDPGEVDPNLAIARRERPRPEDVGRIYVQTLDTYHQGVKANAEIFHDHLTQYLLESEQGTSLGRIYTEIIASTHGFRKSKAVVAERQRAHRVTLEAAHERLIALTVDFGVPEWHRQALMEAYNFALHKDRMNDEVKMQKGTLIFKATAAAIVLPAVFYFTLPIMGALGTSTIAVGGAKSAVFMAALPMAFGAGIATYNATVARLKYGGDWFCHFAEEMVEKGVGALYMAPFMAAIPMASLGAASGVFATGYVVSAEALSAAAAPLIYQGVNWGVALYFVQDMTRNGIHGIGGCQSKIQRLNELLSQDQGSEEYRNVLATEAHKECAQGLFDFTFAFVGGKHIARGGIKAYQAKRGEAPRASGGQSAPPTTTGVEPARIAQAEALLERPLSQPQQQAVQRAHEVGANATGLDGVNPAGPRNYTRAHMEQAKVILQESGFSETQATVLIAEIQLGRPLTPQARAALLKAHSIGELDHLTPAQVAEKTRILSDEGNFSRGSQGDTRLLMDTAIAGKKKEATISPAKRRALIEEGVVGEKNLPKSVAEIRKELNDPQLDEHVFSMRIDDLSSIAQRDPGAIKEAIPELRQALLYKGSSYYRVNASKNAAWLLREMGIEAKAAIPELREALSTYEDTRVQPSDYKTLSDIARMALKEMGPEGEMALKKHELRQGLRSPGSSDRDRAIEGWMEMGPEEAIPELRQALHSGGHEAEGATQALRQMGIKAKEAIPELRQVLHSGGREAVGAAQVLGQMGIEAKAAIPELRQALETSGDSNLRSASAQALGAMGPEGKRALKKHELRQGLRSPGSSDRDRAIEGWMEMGPEEAIPELRQALRRPSEAVGAAQALRQMGIKAKEAIPELRQALETSDNRNLRSASAQALWDMGPKGKAVLKKALEQGNYDICSIFVADVLRYSMKGSPLISELRKALKHPNPNLREAALWELSSHILNPENRFHIDVETLSGVTKTIPELRQALRDTSLRIRLDAVQVLRRMGIEAKEAIPDLKRARDAAEDTVERREIESALSEVDPI